MIWTCAGCFKDMIDLDRREEKPTGEMCLICRKAGIWDLSAIVAMTESGILAVDGKMPWHIPEDLRRFKRLTSDLNAPVPGKRLIMGRKTWDSLPVRPLPGRPHVVLTRGSGAFADQGQVLAHREPHLLHYGMVIGGADVYKQFLPRCKYVFVSWVPEVSVPGAKTLFPLEIFQAHFQHVISSVTRDGIRYETRRNKMR